METHQESSVTIHNPFIICSHRNLSFVVLSARTDNKRFIIQIPHRFTTRGTQWLCTSLWLHRLEVMIVTLDKRRCNINANNQTQDNTYQSRNNKPRKYLS